MSKLRSPWLALFGGAMLIVLSMSTAIAGKPSGTNHGQQISSQVRQNGTNHENTNNSASNHGSCVSAVAKSDAVGGKNNNHGGAVSEAARNTCANDHSATKDESQKDSEGASESEAPESEAPESESPAESPGD